MKNVKKKSRTRTGRPEAAAGCGCREPAVELKFPSCPEYLSLVREAVEWFAARCEFSENDCSRIVLAVVEATTNIIRHAYGGDQHQQIHLRMTRRPDGIELVLLDRGKAVSPARIAAALDRPLEPGGLGVKLMKRCMDHFEYEKRAGGGARLVLRKRRGKPLKGRAPGKDLR